MIKVIIESPYAGNVRKNVEYAKKCLIDSLKRGEAPIASHLLYTQNGLLDDLNSDERKLGIQAGLAWIEVADKQVFYTDLGWSSGMHAALNRGIDEHEKRKMKIEFRKIL